MPISVTEEKLPQVLNYFKMLPEILKKFKDMNICKGISGIVPLNSQSVVAKTYTGTDLRHNNCALLSFNSERCRKCKIYCSSFIKTAKRINHRKTVLRVSSSMNATHQITALRRKVKARSK